MIKIDRTLNNTELTQYGKYIQKQLGSLRKEIDGKIGKRTLYAMKILAYRKARQSTVAEPDFEKVQKYSTVDEPDFE